MQQRQGYQAVEKLRETLDEKYLWEVILLYAGESFKTYTGLPFTYEVRKGRNGDYTRELWIDRRENSKSLALSSVLLALRNIKKVGAVVDRPKALGDIRGVSYIYGMFYRFGLIDVPDTARQKMKFTRIYFLGGKGMNKRENVDSGRKSARPDYIQKTISGEKFRRKTQWKSFLPQTLIKTEGIIIFVLLLGLAGNKFFLSVSKTDGGKG
ncbi:MAG: hypothetical protein ACLVHS_09175 [Blautia wexlerae]